MNNLLHGDWGVSLHSGRDIWGEISSRFKVSAKLGGMAALVAIVVGLVLESIAALTRNRWPDRLIVFFYNAWYGDAVLRACNTASF